MKEDPGGLKRCCGEAGRSTGIAGWDQEDLASGLYDSASFSIRPSLWEKQEREKVALTQGRDSSEEDVSAAGLWVGSKGSCQLVDPELEEVGRIRLGSSEKWGGNLM